MFKAIIRKLLLLEFFAVLIACILFLTNEPYLDGIINIPHRTLLLENSIIPFLLIIIALIAGSYNLERLIFLLVVSGACLFYYSIALLLFIDFDTIWHPQLFTFAPLPLYVPPLLLGLLGLLVIVSGLVLLPKGDVPIVKVFQLKHWILFGFSLTLIFTTMSFDSLISLFDQLTKNGLGIKINNTPKFPVWLFLGGLLSYIFLIHSLSIQPNKAVNNNEL